MKEIHNANSCGDEIFASCMCFSTFWKKCKNAFLLLLFLKQALWTWKYVQKKLVIGPDFHQKFYQNRVISQKYTMLQKVYIFNSTSRYSTISKVTVWHCHSGRCFWTAYNITFRILGFNASKILQKYDRAAGFCSRWQSRHKRPSWNT